MKKVLLLFVPLVFFFSCEQECVAQLDSNCVYLAVWDPICGCDGITYSNSGEAACNNIFEHTEGACLN